jgi:hypothetical protein
LVRSTDVKVILPSANESRRTVVLSEPSATNSGDKCDQLVAQIGGRSRFRDSSSGKSRTARKRPTIWRAG